MESEIYVILSDFTRRLPRPAVRKLLKSRIATPIKKLPKCLLRVSKVQDGFFVATCGGRELADINNIADLGFSLLLNECINCGGFTSAMVKNGETTKTKL
jgi:hypothetical protein